MPLPPPTPATDARIQAALTDPRALEVAERMRVAVAQADLLGQPTTISIGCATLQASEDAHGLYARGDAALYAAKNSGRNRAVAAR